MDNEWVELSRCLLSIHSLVCVSLCACVSCTVCKWWVNLSLVSTAVLCGWCVVQVDRIKETVMQRSASEQKFDVVYMQTCWYSCWVMQLHFALHALCLCMYVHTHTHTHTHLCINGCFVCLWIKSNHRLRVGFEVVIYLWAPLLVFKLVFCMKVLHVATWIGLVYLFLGFCSCGTLYPYLNILLHLCGTLCLHFPPAHRMATRESPGPEIGTVHQTANWIALWEVLTGLWCLMIIKYV